MSLENSPNTLNRYQSLVAVARELSACLDLDGLLKDIVQMAAWISQAEAASILLYDERKNDLYFQCSSDSANEAQLKGIVVPAESIAGWVAIHRQPVIVGDVKQDQRYFQNVEKSTAFPTRSLLAVPLLAGGKLIGVLEVLNNRSGEFEFNDQEVTQALGDQAAIAIQNARLFQQSDLISELVHELRTPLASINTIAYLLQRTEISSEQRQNLAQTIAVEANRLNELASSFLDMARLESGRTVYHPTSIKLQELIHECVTVVQSKATESNLSISNHLSPQLPELYIDRDKLKQVLLNLLSNAIKYNRPGGSIDIEARLEGRKIAIAIKDSGVGVPEDEIPHLFEKFYRARTTEQSTSGTGLGLSICKRIIDDQRGSIIVSSKVDQGTTFTLLLPLPE
jgi:signal transduction histidine kinase